MIDWIIEDIKKNADPIRAKFQKKLCNTKYEIVGCTNPYLRNFAKTLKKSKDYEDFLNSESNVYEYVFLQGILISYLNDVERMKDFIFKIEFLFHNYGAKIMIIRICLNNKYRVVIL